MEDLVQFGRSLAAAVPLARALGVEVHSLGADHVALAAPLGPNANDKGTAFGGSLYAVAVLAGWSLVNRLAQAHGLSVDVVIHEATLEYRAPAAAGFVACARFAPQGQTSRFIRALHRHRPARIAVDILTESAGVLAMHCRASYVATPRLHVAVA
jgi:thioesterase domain-containing protein